MLTSQTVFTDAEKITLSIHGWSVLSNDSPKTFKKTTLRHSVSTDTVIGFGCVQQRHGQPHSHIHSKTFSLKATVHVAANLFLISLYLSNSAADTDGTSVCSACSKSLRPTVTLD